MSSRFGLAALASLLLLGAPALAAPAKHEEASSLSPAQHAYFVAVEAGRHGPVTVPLLDQATLKLAKGYVFVPQIEAINFLESIGNYHNDSVIGMVLAENLDPPWMAVASFNRAGYIRDDDAKQLNADELLNSLKQAAEADNEERRNQGIPEMEVLGWVEKPTYNAAARQLVWSAASQEKGMLAEADHTVNYNTFALGREGYISLSLVTDRAHVERQKPIAKQLLSALAFTKGKRYEDFDADTDKVAEYGLAALVAGVAAKKLGLFALLAVLFAKSFKLIAVAALAVGAFFSKHLFGKKAQPESTPAAPAESATEEQAS